MIVSDTIAEKVQRAEIKMAAFVVEHYLSFQTMDHLSDLLSDIFPDSAIAQKFQSKHTKRCCIVKNVLANEFRTTLIMSRNAMELSVIARSRILPVYRNWR